MASKRPEDCSRPYPFLNYPLPGELGSDPLLFQVPLAQDARLLPKLREWILASESLHLTEAGGFRFRNHELAKLVREPYTPKDLLAIESFLESRGTLMVPIRDEIVRADAEDGLRRDVRIVGATPRATGGEMTGAFWIRDHAQTAMACMRRHILNPEAYREDGEMARELLLGGLAIMSTDSQLNRFDSIITNCSDEGYLNDPRNWPHVFLQFSNLSGVETEEWSHKQDAWQMMAWAAFKALRAGLISLEDLSDRHRAFLARITPFLAAVNFLDRENSGSWEEIEARRTSTLSWDVSLLQEINYFFQVEDFEFMAQGLEKYQPHLDPKYRDLTFSQTLNFMIDAGLDKIEHRTPFESGDYPPDSPKYREADAALLYLLDLGLPQILAARRFSDPAMVDKRADHESYLESLILAQVLRLSDDQTNGIRRYGVGGPTDSYQRGGFWTNLTLAQLAAMKEGRPAATSDFSRADSFVGRDTIVPQGPAAAWVHFVPQISAWACRRYLETHDPEYLKLAETFFNRTLSLVSGYGEYSVIKLDGDLVVQEIPPFRLPECYVYHQDLTTGEYYFGPSPHTPLSWAVAKTREALALMISAAQFRQTQQANF